MREDKEGRVKSVNYSKKFLKSLKRLPERIISEAEKKEKIFKENPFNPILKTHKLSGKEKECWSFWINYSYRIKFIFLNDEEVLFLDIGTHDIYK